MFIRINIKDINYLTGIIESVLSSRKILFRRLVEFLNHT